MIKSWGYELRINAASCDLDKVTDDRYLSAWVRDLVQEIDMEPHGYPDVVHFGHAELTGYTVNQLISTSNISAHFMDHNGDAYVNIFSCKWFNVQHAVDHFHSWFNPKALHHDFTERNVPDIS
jgi:S-adenosylmethionine/arginine decarboxylase-like enzyme